MKRENRIDMRKLKTTCPVCQKHCEKNLGEHIRSHHGEEEFKKVVLKTKEQGMPDSEIGTLFGITFRQLEGIITEEYGINISVLKRPKKIRYWVPKNFKEEGTTVWSFKQRGNWATHDGRYRGNWSPYIPRNVILKYSKPGEIVLDYFVGGGTTAVEAKLLGRRCIAHDINPAAVVLTKENLKFTPPKTLFEDHPIYEPEVSVGDARDLSHIPDNSIDLICAHPPYAGIINYSSKVEGDLSKLNIEGFLEEMKKVAEESYRVLRPGAKCAILIGDTRKKKHVIPIGFKTINVFLSAGFGLKELVIKRQHNCKTTGFWYEKSIRYNFLLLAHEYLPIFEKPKIPSSVSVKEKRADYGVITPTSEEPPLKRKIDLLETTTVWILQEKDFEEHLNKNVIDRYSNGSRNSTVTFVFQSKKGEYSNKNRGGKSSRLLFIKSPILGSNLSGTDLEYYLEGIKDVMNQELPYIKKGGFFVIQTQDVRIGEYLEPLGKRIVDLIAPDNLWLKEIVIVTQEEQTSKDQIQSDHLKMTHQYLVVYEKI